MESEETNSQWKTTLTMVSSEMRSETTLSRDNFQSIHVTKHSNRKDIASTSTNQSVRVSVSDFVVLGHVPSRDWASQVFQRPSFAQTLTRSTMHCDPVNHLLGLSFFFRGRFHNAGPLPSPYIYSAHSAFISQQLKARLVGKDRQGDGREERMMMVDVS